MIIKAAADAISALLCLIMAYWAISFYVKRQVNFEYTLYWGLAHLLEASCYILAYTNVFFNADSINQIIVLFAAIGCSLKFHALAYINVKCDGQHACRVCKKKTIRLGRWGMNIASFALMPLLMRMNETGSMAFFICCIAFDILLYATTPERGYFKFIRAGFGMLLVLHMVQLLKVIAPGTRLVADILAIFFQMGYVNLVFYGVNNITTFRDRGTIE